jgi:hypothetical protein
MGTDEPSLAHDADANGAALWFGISVMTGGRPPPVRRHHPD